MLGMYFGWWLNIKTAAFCSKHTTKSYHLMSIPGKKALKYQSTPFILFLDTPLEGVPTNWMQSIIYTYIAPKSERHTHNQHDHVSFSRRKQVYLTGSLIDCRWARPEQPHITDEILAILGMLNGSQVWKSAMLVAEPNFLKTSNFWEFSLMKKKKCETTDCWHVYWAQTSTCD